MATEILCSLDDVNSELPSTEDPGGLSGRVLEATHINIEFVQVTIARMVRGYLSGVVDNTTLMGWDSPANTPDIVRVAAAKFIASQLLFNAASRTTISFDQNSMVQKLYDQAMDILNKIIAGSISLGPTAPPVAGESMTNDDYFPIDATDRAFTLSMDL
jgi:hypothetical protein